MEEPGGNAKTIKPPPIEALRSFEAVDGIPLFVIAELFARADIPENLQAAFWRQAAVKNYLSFTGKVTKIEDIFFDSEDQSIIQITDSTVPPDSAMTLYFYGGHGLTEHQVETLRDAARAGRTVTIKYQFEGGRFVAGSIAVWF
jgi:hypothetical protein